MKFNKKKKENKMSKKTTSFNIRGNNVSFEMMRDIRFFTNGSNMPNIQSVPIRKVGLTGSGKLLDCRSNASKLAITYGGSEVFGYDVSAETWETEKLERCFFYNPHSVWKTPEGKLVDVTLNSLKREEDTISFIPIGQNNPNDPYYFSDIQIYVVPAMKGFEVQLNYSESHYKYFNRGDIKRNSISIRKLWSLSNTPYLKEFPQKLEKDYVSFSKPSTATGNHFEMRYLPNNTRSRFL